MVWSFWKISLILCLILILIFDVKVSFEAFDYLVDSIGGIEYNVPINMDYDDPGQDLAIHLKAGPQKLNGKQAEGLVRFRKGYDNQDIGRVESTAELLLNEFLKQVMNADTIFSNPSAYINTSLSTLLQI